MALIQEGITGNRCWMEQELSLTGVTMLQPGEKKKRQKLLGVNHPTLSTKPRTEQHNPTGL